MADNILSQARHYNNLPLIKRDIRSVVHLEDAEDEPFWDTILQRVRPGRYHFVYYSKSNKGNNTSGCDQCLKFRPYLSSRFFVCIDSDLRHLTGQPNVDAAHYVIQTYTYSWENHFCQGGTLQASVAAHATGIGFDFSTFYLNLSHALYEPLLLLLYCNRTGNNLLTEQRFRQLLKKQCTSAEARNDGAGYVQYIDRSFTPFLSGSAAIGFDAAVEAANYAARGLNRDNAYLHVRGHNIYDLTVDIGKKYARPLRISFVADVLKQVSVGGPYWEYTQMENDLRSI
mgnify:CR=1 FL=1